MEFHIKLGAYCLIFIPIHMGRFRTIFTVILNDFDVFISRVKSMLVVFNIAFVREVGEVVIRFHPFLL